MGIFSKLLDTSGYPARWDRGLWTSEQVWLHILSDLGIWLAYVAIPCVLIFFFIRGKDLPFRKIFVLFGAFIFSCGTTHLLDAIIFWWPIYRLAGVVKLLTAMVSWATVIALVPMTPRLLAMRNPEDLEAEIKARRAAEGSLIVANAELEGRVERRTRDLAEANESLKNEREWFRTTLASIGDAVIATEEDGRIRFMNGIAQELTGWTQEEAAGVRLSEVFQTVNENTRLAVESPVERVIREGKVVGLSNHTVLISKEGVETPIDDSAAPIRDDWGEVTGVVMVFRDVSEERQAKLQVRRSAERFRALVEASAQIVWTTEPDGSIASDSPSWREFTGQTLEEWVGIGWLDALHADDRDAALEVWGKSVSSMTKYETEYRVRRTDGVYRWMTARGVPLLDSDGRLREWVGMNIDVTDRKSAEVALLAAKEEAEEANRAKTQFLAVLSHELRTPLNPILLAATAMLEQPSDPEQIRPTLEMIRQNVNLQARLIDDLLDVMRIVRGKMPLHWEVVDCHKLIEQTLQICRSEVFGKELTIGVEMEAADCFVNADPARMQQVFWNLIKNAVKFTPGPGTIRIRTWNVGGGEGVEGRIVIEVSDSGIGIEPELLSKIFDPFKQGEQSVTRKFGGLGLGLAICRGIIEAHEGQLTVTSEGKNKGSSFRVGLEALPTPVIDGDEEVRESSVKPKASADMSLRILVVEDDLVTLRLMARLLRGLGHEVATASTIASALEILTSGDFQLIISDIGLPDGSGLELMRQAIERLGAIPGIALTGYGMEDDVRRSREAGFIAHLTKPIDFVKLTAMIGQVV